MNEREEEHTIVASNGDREPQPRLDQLSEPQNQEVADAVSSGRAVDDPRLAHAALQRARSLRRASGGLMVGLPLLGGLMGLAVPPLAFDQDLDVSIALVAAGLLVVIAGGATLSTYADASAATQRNQALLDGRDPDDITRPTALQRTGAILLGLLVGSMAARAVTWVLVGVLAAAGVEIDALPDWMELTLGLALLLVAWWLTASAILDRYYGRTSAGERPANGQS